MDDQMNAAISVAPTKLKKKVYGRRTNASDEEQEDYVDYV